MIKLFLGVATGLAIGYMGCMYYLNSSDFTPEKEGGNGQRACTMEAKLCPDGSAVGRTGPNCEFAACPGE